MRLVNEGGRGGEGKRNNRREKYNEPMNDKNISVNAGHGGRRRRWRRVSLHGFAARIASALLHYARRTITAYTIDVDRQNELLPTVKDRESREQPVYLWPRRHSARNHRGIRFALGCTLRY